jgi:hypothetical protein
VTVNTTLASRWPARLAYAAALLFTAASTITNFLYGLSKGTDFGTSLVWATVSVGVSIVFALSWPALMLSIERRNWSRVVAAFLALLLTGSYSITAALGSASGGRTNAAIAEQTITDQRSKLQASYDAARAELALLRPTRPVAELDAVVAGAKLVCRVATETGKRDTVCVKPPALTSELGRGHRRAELERKMETASAGLATLRPAKVVNSDAAALAGYLSAVGLDVEADRINRLLVLLAVLVIEMGGGLSLAVGLSLVQSAPKTTSTVELNHADEDQCTPRGPRAAPEPAQRLAVPGSLVVQAASVEPRRRPARNGRKSRPRRTTKDHAAGAIMDHLRDRRVMDSSERALARTIGATRATTRRALHGLVAAGKVALDAGIRGSVVRLAAS